MCQRETHIGTVQNAHMVKKRAIRTPEADRLVQARKARGKGDAKATARFFGWNYNTYSQHERGERGLTKKTAEKYAKAFRVSAAWLLHGTGEAHVRHVRIVGYVAAGGAVMYSDELDGDDTVEAPSDSPPETVAVHVRGESLGAGFDRWIALYARREDPITEDMIGRLCVVGTDDGRTLIKWVRRGPGGFNLISGTGAVEENVGIQWAAPVITLKPANV